MIRVTLSYGCELVGIVVSAWCEVLAATTQYVDDLDRLRET